MGIALHRMFDMHWKSLNLHCILSYEDYKKMGAWNVMTKSMGEEIDGIIKLQKRG